MNQPKHFGRGPRYPEIEVRLSDRLSKLQYIQLVGYALRSNGVPEPEVKQFVTEVIDTSHYKLMRLCRKWVSVI